MMANLMLRILFGFQSRGIAHRGTDGDDDVVAFGRQRIDVLLIVGGLPGFEEFRLETHIRGGFLYAFPGQLVERLIIHAAGIGNQTDFNRRAIGQSGSGRGAAAVAAGAVVG